VPRFSPARAAVLWTGGKDSALALDEARRAGIPVAALVTFGPPGAAFRAHPIPVMEAQARSLGLPHRMVELLPPLDAAYRGAFEALAAEGFTHLVTGDIAPVDGRPNWVRERAAGLPLEVLTPLWGRDRAGLLASLRERGFRAILSCVRPPLPPSLCGRPLDGDAEAALRAAGADLCGENGEFHTLVLDGPDFAAPLVLEGEAATGEDGLTTLAVRKVRLGA
jgi:diphthamide synthase (EF-2-diphthine--ammonia ligase)